MVRFLDTEVAFFTRSSTATDSEKMVSYTRGLVTNLVSKVVNSQHLPLTSVGGGRSLRTRQLANYVRMHASLNLSPNSLAVFFLTPDANHYWTPESSD